MPGRREPDFEAEKVRVKAVSIVEKPHFHRSNTHGANRIEAKGCVDIEILKQHPGTRDKNKRPDVGMHLIAADEKIVITVEGRSAFKIDSPGKDGRQNGFAEGKVEIFGAAAVSSAPLRYDSNCSKKTRGRAR